MRRGKVAAFRLDDVALHDVRTLAKFWPLPRRWLRRVLVQVDADGVKPLGLFR